MSSLSRRSALAVHSLRVGFALLLWLGVATAAQPASKYTERLTAARALAAEGSHALAKAAFAEAQKLAPDEDQRRWCRLWILEQTQAEKRTSDVSDIQQELAELVSPYERQGRPQDAFWADAVSLMAGGYRMDLLLGAANFWATQPVTPEGPDALLRALVALGQAGAAFGGRVEVTREAEQLIELALASPALAGRQGLPRLALLHARMLERHRRALAIDLPRITAAYARAVTLSQNTPLAGGAQLYRAGWVLQSGPFATNRYGDYDLAAAARRMQPSAEDFRETLATIDEALTQVPTQPDDYNTKRVFESLTAGRREMISPSLRLETNEAYQPDSRFSFAVTVQHIGEVELKLFRVNLPTLAAVAYPSRNAPALAADPAWGAPVHTWRLKTGIDAPYGRITARRWWPEALAPGAYVLVARDASPGTSETAVRWFLVTKAQAVVQQIGGGDFEVAVMDAGTGRPMGPVAGAAWRERQPFPLVPVEPGRARLPRRDMPPVAGSMPVVGEADGQPFFVAPVHAFAGEPASWRAHLFADRPLYQPGETAQWKLTLRRTEHGELHVPAGERLKIVAGLSDDDILGTWEVTLDAMGSASGKLPLPPSAKPGQVHFGVQRAEDDNGMMGIEAFRVDHFRAPEITLAIEPADPGQLRRARPGARLEFKLAARYFSGEPLGNAKIRAVTRLTRHPFFPGPEGNGDDAAKPIAPPPLEAVTDAKGEARLSLLLPANLPPYAWGRVETVLEGSGVNASAMFPFELLPHGFMAELAPASQASPQRFPRGFQNDLFIHQKVETKRLLARPDQPVSLALFVRDGRGAPISVPGEITVERVAWDEVWRTPEGEFVTGLALRGYRRYGANRLVRDFGWERIHAAERLETVERISITSDAGGRTAVVCSALPVGCYRVSFLPDEAAAGGDMPMSQLDLFVADAATSWLPFHTEEPVLIPADISPGEPVRVLAILPSSERQALVGIGGVASGESRIESFGGNARLLEFGWRSGYWSGTRVALALADPQRDTFAQVDVIPSRAPQAMRVEIAPEASRARPGDRTRLRIRTLDGAGRPVAAQVALSVADRAVTSLAPLGRSTASDTFLAPEHIGSIPAAFGVRPVNRGEVASPGTDPAAQLQEETITLSPFEVSTEMSMGYAAGSAMAGGRVAGVEVAAAVRGTFSHTAFWGPDIRTDDRGEATVEFAYPDNLTQWQVSAESVAAENCFGAGQAATQTTLPLQARLRMPRSVVAGDTMEILGAVVNAGPEPTNVQVGFEVSDPASLALASASPPPFLVEASHEKIVPGGLRAIGPGESLVRLKALTPTGGDAMEWKLPVGEDGFVQRTGLTARATARTVAVTLSLPKPLDPNRTRVELQISPGIVPALVEALPYLVDYPYGCVEQTMSRFLPAAAVAKLLRDLGFTPAEVEARLFAGTKRARGGAAGVGQLDEVIQLSLTRLAAAQNQDGSFGWFAGGEPDPYMTGYVLRGLWVAAAAGVPLPEQMIEGAFKASLGMLEDEPRGALPPARVAWLLNAITGLPASAREGADVSNALNRAFDRLYAARAALSPASLALLAQSAVALERSTELPILRRNLENAVSRQTSAEFGATAQWGLTSGYYDGLDGAVEATALSLQALLAFDPQDPLVDAAATWLLVNRQSGRWHNTRDTALSVLALHDYARARGATVAEGRYRVSLGSQVIAERSFDRDSLLQPATIAVDPKLLRPGANRITLTRLDGSTPCYLVATTESWAQAATAKPAGSFLILKRDYLGVTRQPTLIGLAFPQVAALPAAAARVATNDLVECRLVLQAKHDLEYVAIEVPKPGGCEPVNPLSGWDATLRRLDEKETDAVQPARNGPTSRIYREEHPDRSVFFLPRVEAGRWEIRYRMRAVFGGDYRALPATAEAMYVPVIQANTEARRLQISPATRP